MKQALITGITGQDGSYLAELLLSKGYEITGLATETRQLQNLGTIKNKLKLVEGDVRDERLIRRLIGKKFDEVYNFASVSTVQKPWDNPIETVESCGVAPLYMLEAIRATAPDTCFFQASSAEMYGEPEESPQSELTPFNPRSPYAYGKLLAHHATEGYRAQGIFCVSGILFNHESPRRGENFVTRKITSTLARIANGSKEMLILGNLDAARDWSFAGDIVEGIWRSLQHEGPGTYVLASGKAHTVREFIEATAHALGMTLRWEGSGANEKGLNEQGAVIIEVSPEFYRPTEKQVRQGDISKIKKELNWQPKLSFEALVRMMAESDATLLKRR